MNRVGVELSDSDTTMALSFLRRTEAAFQVDTPEFKKWFGRSQIRDEQGEPMVVYHGTGDDFSSFDRLHLGKQTQAADTQGFFFARSPKVASEFAWKEGEPGNVMPCYLRMENPFISDIMVQAHNGREFLKDIERARAEGYDGVAAFGEYLGTESAVYVVFDPKQIKSATGNRGAFDPDSSDITEEKDLKFRRRAEEGVSEEQEEVSRLQAELDVAKAALAKDKSNANFRSVQRLTSMLDTAQERLASAKTAEAPAGDGDYRGAHRPPGPDDGAPACDLTANGVYPDDVYGPRGAAEYGYGYETEINKILRLHNQPEAWVWVYRAVPSNVSTETHKAFRPGDWVTTSKEYAHEHGQSNLNNDYKVARKRVHASEIFTDGNSLHEWGYWPNRAQQDGVTERETPKFTKPKNPEFKRWFGRSKCTQVQYHTTPADFDEFDTGRSDLGAHFGSLEQATKRSTTLAGRPGDAWSTMPCWLSIQNPLRLRDEGSFHADAIVWQLARKGIISRAEAKQIEDAIYDDWETRKEYDPKMVAAIKKAGYDGIVYKNEHEGEGDSWIVFDPNQIKSAIGNSGAFDPASNKVTDAVHADIDAAVHRLA